MLFERVKELSKMQGKNLKTVATELGFGENYLYTLKRQTPSAENIEKIADYFQVSTDYLLGRTEIKSVATSETDPYGRDLNEFLERNMGGMSFKKNELTDEDNRKLEAALKLVFDKYYNKD